jgi:hypothetical protein
MNPASDANFDMRELQHWVVMCFLANRNIFNLNLPVEI